jgi:hypothetical protein
MSAIMSAMKSKQRQRTISVRSRSVPAEPETFTVRDLNRQPARILRTCDERGSVRIRSRDGRTYNLRAESTTNSAAASTCRQAAWERFLQHRLLLKALGAVSPGPEAVDRIHRIIAGEA